MKSKILAIAALGTLAVFNCFPRVCYSQPLLVSKESTTPTSIIIDDEEMAQLPMPVRQGLELYLAGNTGGAVDVWLDNANELPRRKRTGYQNQNILNCRFWCSCRYSLSCSFTYLAIIPSSPCFPTVLA